MRLFTLVSVMLIATPCLASAQSVLERVLGQIENSTNLGQVNGTFANIAETISPSRTETETVYEKDGVTYTQAEYDVLLAAEQALADAAAAAAAGSAVTITYQDRDGLGPLGAGYYVGDPTAAGSNPPPGGTWYDTLEEAATAAGITTEILVLAQVASALPLTYSYQVDGEGPTFTTPGEAIASATSTITESLITTFEETFTSTTTEFQVPGDPTIINGSINNILIGINGSTQQVLAGLASATEWVRPTFDFGDLSTTALGAVNTGEITLGVNSAVDEAKTTTANAISATLTQIGGSADAGAVVVNVAHNASMINGSINNVIAEVNGTIGNLSTTALGAVNTGTITSGVDATVAGIVGMSGQSGL